METRNEYTKLTSVEIGDHGAIVENNSYHQMNHTLKLSFHVDLHKAIIIYDAICLFITLLTILDLENEAVEYKLTLAMIFAFACGIYGACQKNTWMVGIAVVPCLFLVMMVLWMGQAVWMLLLMMEVQEVLDSHQTWISVWLAAAMTGLYLMLLALVSFGVFVHIRYIRGIRKNNP